jgi:hypothetical protein
MHGEEVPWQESQNLATFITICGNEDPCLRTDLKPRLIWDRKHWSPYIYNIGYVRVTVSDLVLHAGLERKSPIEVPTDYKLN